MFNKSEIMTKAHAAAKACFGSKFYAGRSYAELLAIQLRRAWSEAKAMARPVILSKAERIKEQIFNLENKTHWGRSDYLRHDALTAELREAA